MVLLNGQIITHVISDNKHQAVYNASASALDLIEKFHFQLIFLKRCSENFNDYLAALESLLENRHFPGRLIDMVENLYKSMVDSSKDDPLCKEVCVFPPRQYIDSAAIRPQSIPGPESPPSGFEDKENSNNHNNI